MKMVAIGDVVEKVVSVRPADHFDEPDFTYVDIAAVSQVSKAIDNPQTLACDDAPSRARQVLQHRDVLVSTVRPNLNAVARIHTEHDGVIASTGFTVLRPSIEKMDSDYLYHWVRTEAFIKDMTSKATGQSYPAVSDRIVKASLIPLPPLEEQKRIAGILDQADALRRLRARALEKLNTLGQAVFQEMFGDPLINPYSLEVTQLSKTCQFISGATPSKADDRLWGGDFPWVSPKDMKQSEIWDAQDHISEMAFEKTSLKKISVDSVLIVVRGMILAHTVPIALTKVPCAINQDMKAMVVNDEFDPVFIVYCLQAMKKHILSLVDNAAHGTKRVDMQDLSSLPILSPSLDIQKDFAARIDSIETQIYHEEAALNGCLSLFASLQSATFQGRL